VEEDFDFLVVATGMYSSSPHMPVAPGAEAFKGQILHSCTFTDRRAAIGKKVIVVGGGKSAVDNAVAAAKGSESTVLLCREAHWPVPRYLANLVPFQWGTYSRFGHSTLPRHHAESACSKALHWLLAPLKWLWWRIVELLFWCQFRLPREQVPKSRIEVDLFSGGQILSYEFRDMCRRGQVSYTLGAISRFEEDGVVLKDGSKLDADMVIYGTGFAKDYSIFDESVQSLLDLQKDGFWLYRNMIPASLRDLAFIGCEVSTFNNILTHGLQALWLQRLFTGKLQIPAGRDMEKAVEQDRAWTRSWMPASSARAAIWQLHMMRYHDSLLGDMGERHRRKGWNLLAEIFAPYSASDYKGLFSLVMASSWSNRCGLLLGRHGLSSFGGQKGDVKPSALAMDAGRNACQEPAQF
jgi:dimethylaniline monooxygenase (N-oxide forming)